MTWNDRVSFVLTSDLTTRRVAALDVITEQPGASDEDERFDGEFAMMAGELAQMLSSAVHALGGERVTQTDAQAVSYRQDRALERSGQSN